MATLDSIIKQMILSAFRSAKMESASPGKINRFLGMEFESGMDIIGSTEEINDAIREAVANIVNDPDSAENLAEDLLNAEEKTGKKKGNLESQTVSGIRKGLGVAQNPANIVSIGLPLLPHAVLVTFAIMLAPLIFTVLTKPGGPLDLRWRRIIDDEINAFLSRQTQRDTEMGVRQVIIQSKTGFTAVNGFNNYNTVKGIREGGVNQEQLSRIGKVDHSKGVFDFG